MPCDILTDGMRAHTAGQNIPHTSAAFCPSEYTEKYNLNILYTDISSVKHAV